MGCEGNDHRSIIGILANCSIGEMPTFPTQERQLRSVVQVTWVVTRHLVTTLPTRATP